MGLLDLWISGLRPGVQRLLGGTGVLVAYPPCRKDHRGLFMSQVRGPGDCSISRFSHILKPAYICWMVNKWGREGGGRGGGSKKYRVKFDIQAQGKNLFGHASTSTEFGGLRAPDDKTRIGCKGLRMHA